ncbi:hypothetical protein PF005_g13283 [Phytophthora fragariae]|uniref:Uncharacterized protein n=1 Tax=Phytophthora fragariae TaxID=53985 RepID=A0A6A3DZ10_9STRA|nr:hypothetical protein PF009_g22891 [Phytophthora fragariae]KAE8957044.1 hypothetical protein PF011_g31280 [Phytophthora fragariae]KAE9059764.1 hypothetical protein PF006_g31797 [Phytophthora fragariae]KAE9061990.1 hypothetical protein PF010_g29599 [Phytophthora fragariae]KAE9082131.1 hypothetical protein PF007_g22393 [Phytophthora fragariae]
MISTSKMCSAMLAMVLLSEMHFGNADASTFTGSYTRTSVSPDACNVPTNCNYQCAETYTITTSGDSLTIKPTSTPTASDCTCYTLSATVSGNTASGTYGSSLSYALELSSSGITVGTTVDGTTCKGTYSSSGTSSAWTYSSADLLGLAMTGVAIYYQG